MLCFDAVQYTMWKVTCDITFKMPTKKRVETQVLLTSDIDSLDELARQVNNARCIVVFSGAGVSTDSGIPVGNNCTIPPDYCANCMTGFPL